jgi:poly(3-hydroxybutyrate) depolymerase
MLYALHEMQHAALAPMNVFAKASLDLLTSPLNPFAQMPGTRNLAAGTELFLRLTNRYEKPAFGIDSTDVAGQKVAVHEELELDLPFCQLRHFRRDTKVVQPTVLLVAPLSGHFATLLRDTVRALIREHDVYVTDWVDAKMVPLSHGTFHLDDYVEYVRKFIRHLGPAVHVVSVCQPTVPVLAAVSLMASADEDIAPCSMIMMGGPIDARRSPTAVNDLAMRKPYAWFENHVIYSVPAKYPGYMRRVYPGFLQHMGFVAMNPRRHMDAHWDFYNHLRVGDGDSAEGHRRFYDEYNAVLDMPAEYYLDTIRTVFQEFALPEGSMVVHGDAVRPGDIRRTALLTIEGELDDISGNGQTEAAHKLCTGIAVQHREHYAVPEVGHYGIFSGRRWRELICPRIAAFIRAHPAPLDSGAS